MGGHLLHTHACFSLARMLYHIVNKDWLAGDPKAHWIQKKIISMVSIDPKEKLEGAPKFLKRLPKAGELLFEMPSQGKTFMMSQEILQT